MNYERDIFEIGKLAVVLVLGICVLTGGGVPTETKPSVSQTNAPTANNQTTEQPRGTKIGQIALDFELEKAGGGTISSKDLEGNLAVLVF